MAISKVKAKNNRLARIEEEIKQLNVRFSLMSDQQKYEYCLKIASDYPKDLSQRQAIIQQAEEYL